MTLDEITTRIADPGQFTKREQDAAFGYETVSRWSARAVLMGMEEAEVLRQTAGRGYASKADLIARLTAERDAALAGRAAGAGVSLDASPVEPKGTNSVLSDTPKNEPL